MKVLLLASKRKHTNITLATKVDKMSIEYEVGKATIYGWLEKKLDLLIYLNLLD